MPIVKEDSNSHQARNCCPKAISVVRSKDMHGHCLWITQHAGAFKIIYSRRLHWEKNLCKLAQARHSPAISLYVCRPMLLRTCAYVCVRVRARIWSAEVFEIVSMGRVLFCLRRKLRSDLLGLVVLVGEGGCLPHFTHTPLLSVQSPATNNAGPL